MENVKTIYSSGAQIIHYVLHLTLSNIVVRTVRCQLIPDVRNCQYELVFSLTLSNIDVCTVRC